MAGLDELYNRPISEMARRVDAAWLKLEIVTWSPFPFLYIRLSVIFNTKFLLKKHLNIVPMSGATKHESCKCLVNIYTGNLYLVYWTNSK